MNTRRRILAIALAVYAAFVLLVTLTPRMPGILLRRFWSKDAKSPLA